MQVLGRLGPIVVQRFMAIIVKVAMTISQNLCVQHTVGWADGPIACRLRLASFCEDFLSKRKSAIVQALSPLFLSLIYSI